MNNDQILKTKKNKKVKSFSVIQAHVNRDMIENLRWQLDEMYHIAKANFALIQKMFDFDHALLACSNAEQLAITIKDHFSHIWQLPHVFLKAIPSLVKTLGLGKEYEINHAQAIKALDQLTKPQSGVQCIHPKFFTYFEKKRAPVESFLHLPIQIEKKTVAIILIGHEDPDYFSTDAPTDYVAILAKSVGIAIQRLIEEKTN